MEKESATEKLIAFIFAIFLTPFAILMDGYVIMKLYNWLISTVFLIDGLVLIEGIAISVIVSFIVLRAKAESEKKDDETYLGRVITLFIDKVFKSLLFLFIGYVVYVILT